MTTHGGSTAELLLIADEPIDGRHIKLAVKLAGRSIEFSAVNVGSSGRFCTWPLQVEIPNYTAIDNAGSHLWYIAGYLYRNRETITQIRALGCNLQLNLSGVSLSRMFSISACTLKWLGDLDVQLELRGWW